MAGPDDERGGEARWLALIFALAFVARAVLLLELRGSALTSVLIGDAELFDAWGARMAAGDWVGDEVFFLAPLYPYFLGGVYALFGHAPEAARWIQVLLGAGSCVLVAVAGARLFTPLVGRLAGGFLALYAPAIWHDALIQKTALATFLTALFLACFAVWATRRGERARHAPLVASGLALGLLALTRENAAVLLVVAALWVLLESRASPLRPRLVRTGVLLLAFLAPLVPVALRNQHVAGELRTTYNLGFNFYVGNNLAADGLYAPLLPGRGRADYEREDATRLAAAELGHPPSPSEVSRFWLARALEEIRASPGGWVRLLGRKALRFFQAREAMDTEALEAYTARSLLLRVADRGLHFGILLPLAAVGLWTTRARWRELWFLHASIAAVALSVILFFVVARFRMTLVPLLLPFAGAGLVELGARLHRRAGLLVPLLLVAGSVVLVTRAEPPSGDPYARTLSNLGAALLDRGRALEAQELLREAVERDPALADARFNLGNALARAGDPDRAAEQYLYSARLEPSYLAAACNRIGVLRSELGDEDGAETWFLRARDAAPDEAESWHNLGYLRSLQGRIAEATALYREALARDPDYLPALRELSFVLAAHPDASVRDAGKALLLAEHAVAIAGDDPGFLDLLALAQAELGRFAEAARTAERAARLADEAGRAELAAGIRERLALYRAGRTVRGS